MMLFCSLPVIFSGFCCCYHRCCPAWHTTLATVDFVNRKFNCFYWNILKRTNGSQWL